jgi:hypothetical protein
MSSPSLFSQAAKAFAVMLVGSTVLVGSATLFIYVGAREFETHANREVTSAV